MNRNLIHKSSKQLKAQDDILSDPLDYNSGCDFIPQKGRPGYSKAINLIKRLIEQGYEDIDIIIQLHEELPNDIAQIALTDAKSKGLL